MFSTLQLSSNVAEPNKLMYLVVGLGNPGLKYLNTRHNIGFDVVMELASRNCVDLPSKKKSNSLVSDVRIGNENCILALPQQFMNRSGQPVASLMAYFKIPLKKVIVVHDELDIPFGTIKLKQQGGHGGHNGLRDIIQHIGKEFIRLRVGVGRPPKGWDTANFVLGRWSKVEMDGLSDLKIDACNAVESILQVGVLDAMQTVNAKI